jgi:Protein of unknown function (DUF1549)/Protein of unknown function (DUF1553)
MSRALGMWTFLVLVSSAWGADPLHQRIDRAIAARAGGPVAATASDAEFLRRVYLDLAGTIPTVEETRKFLADTDKAKRTRLIDRLLASSDFARRMQEFVTVWLLERRPGTVISDSDWNTFLRSSFAANKPWDQLIRELVAADGRDPRTRAGMRFFVDGDRSSPDHAALDVGRLFLGMNLHCAQCHNHPNVSDYRQAHYFGIYAYLRQSKLQRDNSKRPFLVETIAKEKAEFKSVFSSKREATGPRLPGRKEVTIPTFKKGEAFAAPARDGLPGVPTFRPRQLLASDLTAGDNRRFVRNSVNRFWSLMMGRGLVQPLDMMHSDNPPSHPQLLEMLADDFVAHRFNVKFLLREIALSQAYQRSSVVPDGVDPAAVKPESYRIANARGLSAEQLAWSLMQATGTLARLRAAPVPKASKFSHKDYVNGRVAAPTNLPDVMKLFAGTFGNPPGEAEVEFTPSMGQSLFLMNEKLILNWLKPGEGTLVSRLAKEPDPAKIAEELYLTILSRLPEAEEKKLMTDYFTKHSKRGPSALGEAAWALLTSAEFRLNH